MPGQRHFASICLVLLFALSPSAGTAKATANLQSTNLAVGDIAVLVIEFESNVPSLLPLDTTPLLADFEVLQVKPSLRRKQRGNKIVNVMQWEVELYPRREGTLKIPPLTLEDQQSPELSLRVNERNRVDRSQREFYLEASTDKAVAYAGEQIILTMRLFHSRPLRQGVIFDPDIDDTDIYSHGPDRQFRLIIDNRALGVLERKLVLFAREPGRLNIPAIEFRGEPESGRTQRIRRQSQAFELDILPAILSPAGNQWLPATNIEVSQQWFQSQENLSIGDSVSRKLTVRAKGLAAEYLPGNLFSHKSTGVEVYADQPKRSNSFDAHGITGNLEQTFVMVFTAAGKVKIADAELHWHEVSTDTQQHITLPGKTISISLPVVNANAQQQQPGHEIWLYRLARQPSTIPILITIVIFLIACRWLSHRTRGTEGFNRQKFKKACLSGNSQAAHEQVRKLAAVQLHHKPIPGLYDLIKDSNSAPFQKQLRLLDRAVYGLPDESWNGVELWRTYLQREPVNLSRPKKHIRQLPALYPR